MKTMLSRGNKRGREYLFEEFGPSKNPLLWHCEFYAPY